MFIGKEMAFRTLFARIRYERFQCSVSFCTWILWYSLCWLETDTIGSLTSRLPLIKEEDPTHSDTQNKAVAMRHRNMTRMDFIIFFCLE